MQQNSIVFKVFEALCHLALLHLTYEGTGVELKCFAQGHIVVNSKGKIRQDSWAWDGSVLNCSISRNSIAKEHPTSQEVTTASHWSCSIYSFLLITLSVCRGHQRAIASYKLVKSLGRQNCLVRKERSASSCHYLRP